MHNFGDCRTCPTGTKPKSNRRGCMRQRNGCSAGRYTFRRENGVIELWECRECPSGKTSRKGATSARDCFVDSCSAGEYNSGSSCVTCPSGRYQTETHTGSSCTGVCPKGSYGSGRGKTSVGSGCSSCPSGQYNENQGSSSSSACKSCSSGQFASSGSGSCTECPDGKVQPDSKQSSCKSCPRGTRPNNRKTLCEIQSCPKGSFLETVGHYERCQKCASGQYKPNVDKRTSCISCPDNSKSSSGSSTCQCQPGFKQTSFRLLFEEVPAVGLNQSRELEGKQSESLDTNDLFDMLSSQCQKGFSSACLARHTLNNTKVPVFAHQIEGNTTFPISKANQRQLMEANARGLAPKCEKCESNSVQPEDGKNSCKSCPSGSSPNADRTFCTLDDECGVGEFYVKTSYYEQCKSCLAGKFQSSTSHRHSECKSCPSGRKSSKGSSSCIPERCDAGTRYDSNEEECVSCPDGQIQPNSHLRKTSCSSCPLGKWHNSAKTKCDDCQAGTKRGSGDNECISCDLGYFSGAGSTSCDKCGVGQYGSGDDRTSETKACTRCPAGKVNPDEGQSRSNSCSSCPSGTWSDSANRKCEDCPAGQFQSSNGCKECASGKWSQAKSSSCTECRAGKYGTGSGRTSENQACQTCPEGKVSSSSGATSSSACKSCGDGEWSSSDNTKCNKCKAGTYFVLNSDMDGCEQCPVGRYSRSAGATACEKCEAGKFGNRKGQGEESEACQLCPVGRVSTKEGADGESTCDKCPSGKWTSSGDRTKCEDCPAGTHQTDDGCQPCGKGTYSSAGATTCSVCIAGKYNPSTESTSSSSCKMCPEGKYNSETGQTSESDCQKCDSGTWSNDARDTCIPCVPGTYQTTTGCQPCQAGYYNTKLGMTSCTACDKGTYSGQVGQTSDETCKACPAGKIGTKEGAKDLSDCADCEAGTFSESDGSTACNQCKPGKHQSKSSQSSCNACPSGYYSKESGSTECSSCPAGTIAASKGAVECENCSRGKYAASTTECSDCPAGLIAPEDGQAECQACKAGTVAKDSGQTECVSCQAGYFQRNPGETQCETCFAGQYTESRGKTSCTGCSAGRFAYESSSVGCGKCPAGTKNRGYNAEKLNIFESAQTTYYDIFTYGDLQLASERPPARVFGDNGDSSFEMGASEIVGTTNNDDESFTQTYIKLPVHLDYNFNGKGCVMCLPGKYASEEGASECSKCSAGKYQPGMGHDFCLACPAGYFTDDSGHSECSICPAGKHQNEAGQTMCLDCEKGTIAKVQGSSVCDSCNKGKYAPEEGMSECSLCTSGRFQAIIRQSSCEACPEGTAQSQQGQSSCDTCAAGKVQPSTDQANCIACPVGKVQSDEGKTQCIECGKGNFADVEGITTCKSCPKGYYAPDTGAKTCAEAGKGHYVDEIAASSRKKCPAGTYASSTTSESDKCDGKCEEGYFCPEEGQTIPDPIDNACPPGRYGIAGEINEDCTADCDKGFYCPSATGRNQQLECGGPGKICRGGNALPEDVGAGWVGDPNQAVNGSKTFYGRRECRSGHFCQEGIEKECPAGRYNSNFRQSECTDLCSAGWFCPKGSSRDKVEACGVGSHPSRYYCPKGTDQRKTTTDHPDGTFSTDVIEAEQHRTGEADCPDGLICRDGEKHLPLEFTDDVCGPESISLPTINTFNNTGDDVPLFIVRLYDNIKDEEVNAENIQVTVQNIFQWTGCDALDTRENEEVVFVKEGTIELFLGQKALDFSPIECPFFRVNIKASVDGGDSFAECTFTIHTHSTTLTPLFSSTAVTVFNDRGCAIEPDTDTDSSWGGKIVCWGNQEDQDKGILSPPDAYQENEDNPEAFTMVKTSETHSCGLTSRGRLQCWPAVDESGTVDQGKGPYSIYKTEPDGISFSSIDVGYEVTCGLLSGATVAGQIHCFGVGFDWAPGGQFIQLSLGGETACAVTFEGEIKCWGDGSFGLTTDFPKTDTEGTSGEFILVEVSSSHSACAIDSQGTMACWGSRFIIDEDAPDGETGKYGPYVIDGKFDKVAIGGDWHCARLKDSGHLQCFGDLSGVDTIPGQIVREFSADGSSLCVVYASNNIIQCFGDSIRKHYDQLRQTPAYDAGVEVEISMGS